MHAAAAFVLSILWAALFPGHALAQSNSEVQQFGDWHLVRESSGACQLMTRLVSSRSGATLLDMILHPVSDAAATVGMRLPTGASLQDIPAYRHPNTPGRGVPLEWQSCDGEMCTARTDIDQAALDRLKRGRQVHVAFRPLPASPPIVLEVSLTGVTAGWNASLACAGG